MPAATAPRPTAFVPPPPPPAASEPAAPGTPPEPDPPSLAAGLDPEDRPAFEAVQRAFEVRLRPVDAGERLLVAAIAACHFRRVRLDAIEARLTGALLDGRPVEGLPSLPALARVRAALAKEQESLHRDLARLYELRPAPIRRAGLDPARLRWLAARIEEGRLRPWAPPDPEPDGPSEPAGDPLEPPAAAHAAPEPTAEAPTPARPTALGEPTRHTAPEPSAARPAPRPAATIATGPTVAVPPGAAPIRHAPPEPAAAAGAAPRTGSPPPPTAATPLARPTGATPQPVPRPESRSSIA
jgi:hypothetical protein